MAYAGYDSAGKKLIRERLLVDFRETDDDFYATVKEKDKKQREKKKEIQQRILNGDFLSNISERNKAFRSRKDALINKMSETDEVCATKSFLVIINHDNEAVFYHGHPSLTTKFFTTGLDRECVSEYYNTRMVSKNATNKQGIFYPSLAYFSGLFHIYLYIYLTARSRRVRPEFNQYLLSSSMCCNKKFTQ